MADRAQPESPSDIPEQDRDGSGRMAAALLDELARADRVVARRHALEAVGGDEERARRGLGPDALVTMFDAARVDRRFVRRVGRALVREERIGLRLRMAGIGSPERALRCCDQLLICEGAGDQYCVESIEPGRAVVRFVRAPGSDACGLSSGALDGERLLCALREGMLQDLPARFGYAQTRVRELDCAQRGDEVCRFEVAWETRRAARAAKALSLGAAVGAIAAAWVAPVPAAFAVCALMGACAALGWERARFLAHCLEAGEEQLRALPTVLEQAERAVAEKIDALAKLGATLERADQGRRAAGIGAAIRGDTQGEDPDASDLAGLCALAGEVRAHERGLCELQQRTRRRGWRADARVEAMIESAAERGRRLCELVSEIEASVVGEDVPRRERVDLAGLVGRKVASLRARLPMSLALEAAVSPTPVYVQGDAVQLEQIVEQLVQNASNAVAGQGRIDVAVRSEADRALLEVADDGPGIDDESIDRLFDPFFESPARGCDGADAPASGSDGQGLSICYRIAREHGGELQVRGEPGAGTRVSVSLPPAVDTAPSQGVHR